jgi:hypothetical protein
MEQADVPLQAATAREAGAFRAELEVELQVRVQASRWLAACVAQAPLQAATAKLRRWAEVTWSQRHVHACDSLLTGTWSAFFQSNCSEIPEELYNFAHVIMLANQVVHIFSQCDYRIREYDVVIATYA